jgi:hypothetical protein
MKMLKPKIDIRYFTEVGTECNSYVEALVMSALEAEGGPYLQSYQKEQVVATILKHLTVRIKKEIPPNEP